MSTKKTSNPLVTRREAILRVSAMLGGTALVGQTAMLAACSEAEKEPLAAPPETKGNGLFSAAEVAYLDEIADTILPETGTPGAKAAAVGAFMAIMVTDTYYENDQQIFRQGMDSINSLCNEAHGSDFVAASAEQRLGILEALDIEQFEYMRTKSHDQPTHYFRMMKELSLLGYFTSEIGYTQAMRYVETPGRYDPCVPFKPGDKVWASHA